MIIHLEHKKIDKTKWDEAIAHSFNGLIYGFSWYLDIVSPGWEALIENDYERIFPLTARKKSGIHYLCQPAFTQQLGIFSRSILEENVSAEFMKHIPEKFKLIEINLNSTNKVNLTGNHFSPYRNFELDLIPSYEFLFKNYSENAKRNLKKAIRSGLEINYSPDLNDIISLFRAHRGKAISTLKEQEYEILRTLATVLQDKKKIHFRAVKSPSEPMSAAAVFFESHKRVIFIFSATSQEAKTTGAMTFLIDHFIKENSQRDLILDFEGSNNLDLARFYRSFGSTENSYFHYKKDSLPAILSKSVTFMKWFKKQI